MISLNLPSIFSKILQLNFSSTTKSKDPKRLPIGIQTFQVMIEEDFVYIDKTEYIYKILKAGKVFFYAHPRRFGKSLLISTMQSIFENKRELFKGLWIDSSDYNWQEYPVIALNFAVMSNESLHLLKYSLTFSLNRIFDKYNIPKQDFDGILVQLEFLIQELSKINKVVILIDEYDYPLINNIEKKELAEELRVFLSGFYNTIKNCNSNLHFVFLTGVSKFSQVSVFSGLNNLCDISYKKEYAQMLGYTKVEIEKAFCDYIKIACEELNMTHDQLMQKLEDWYFGYQFSENKKLQVFSPFSIILFFQNLKFDNYWFATGTPTFLLKMMKLKDFQIPDIDNVFMSSSSFAACDFDKIEIVPLLLQTGYLTIDEYCDDSQIYTLRLPTLEVKEVFLKNISPYLNKTSIDLSKKKELEIENFEQQNKDKLKESIIDEERMRIAKNLLTLSIDILTIVQATAISVEQIQELMKNKKNRSF